MRTFTRLFKRSQCTKPRINRGGSSLRLEALEKRRLMTTVHGDFNDDGYDDLAVGVPYEDVGAIANAGAVNVIYGSPNGLTPAGDQLWHQDSPGILGRAEANDRFGAALAAGDFNGDGLTDFMINTTTAGAGWYVYLSNGDGTFTTFPFSSCDGGSVSGVAAADFTGDGVTDIAAVYTTASSISTALPTIRPNG